MPGLPPRTELLELIETAMKEFAPTMHRELKREQGALQAALLSRAELAETTYSDLISQARTETSRESNGLSPQQMISEMAQAKSRAAEVALAQAVEFGATEPGSDETTQLPQEA